MRAFLEGALELDEIREPLAALKAELAKIEDERAEIIVSPVIALHPRIGERLPTPGSEPPVPPRGRYGRNASDGA